MEFNQLSRDTIREAVLAAKDLNAALDMLTTIGIDTDNDDIFHYTEDLRELVIDKQELIWNNKG